MERTIIKSRDFNAYFGSNHVVKHVNMDIPKNNVVAVMGPSGCGKTTFLRCINRMHELIPGATQDGDMMLNSEHIYQMHPIFVRLKIGMVFQRPNPFPNLSIYDNVIAGYKLNGIKLSKAEKDLKVEESLAKAALWNEVKDSLHKKGCVSPAPLPWSPKCCCWMNRLRPSIPFPRPVLKSFCTN
jgi:phosphate transport system ATP-binding protein